VSKFQKLTTIVQMFESVQTRAEWNILAEMVLKTYDIDLIEVIVDDVSAIERRKFTREVIESD
jgi:hypothetical protein